MSPLDDPSNARAANKPFAIEPRALRREVRPLRMQLDPLERISRGLVQVSLISLALAMLILSLPGLADAATHLKRAPIGALQFTAGTKSLATAPDVQAPGEHHVFVNRGIDVRVRATSSTSTANKHGLVNISLYEYVLEWKRADYHTKDNNAYWRTKHPGNFPRASYRVSPFEPWTAPPAASAITEQSGTSSAPIPFSFLSPKRFDKSYLYEFRVREHQKATTTYGPWSSWRSFIVSDLPQNRRAPLGAMNLKPNPQLPSGSNSQGSSGARKEEAASIHKIGLASRTTAVHALPATPPPMNVLKGPSGSGQPSSGASETVAKPTGFKPVLQSTGKLHLQIYRKRQRPPHPPFPNPVAIQHITSPTSMQKNGSTHKATVTMHKIGLAPRPRVTTARTLPAVQLPSGWTTVGGVLRARRPGLRLRLSAGHTLVSKLGTGGQFNYELLDASGRVVKRISARSSIRLLNGGTLVLQNPAAHLQVLLGRITTTAMRSPIQR